MAFFGFDFLPPPRPNATIARRRLSYDIHEERAIAIATHATTETIAAARSPVTESTTKKSGIPTPNIQIAWAPFRYPRSGTWKRDCVRTDGR